MNKKFCFYGNVIYSAKYDEIPKGSLGLHIIEGEDEEKLKKIMEDNHNKNNLHIVDMFGKTTKARFRWYGEIK